MQADVASWIAEVEELKEKGDLLLAFDRAAEHVKAAPDSEALKHAGLLALARAGATDQASRLFDEWDLDDSENADILALEARLAKDRALKQTGAARRAMLLDAAELYGKIHARKPTYYTAINQASLYFLGGDRDKAAGIARAVLADPAVVDAADYWSLATRAEADIVLLRLDTARADLELAAQAGAGVGAKSTTRRQLRLLLAEAGLTPGEVKAFLAPLDPPITAHVLSASFLGGNWPSYAAPDIEAASRRRIDAQLDALKPGSVFTALGTAAEILFAEQALARGVELTAVLSLPEPLFIEQMRQEAGADWAERVLACCRKARRVVVASDDAELVEVSMTIYARRVAMGLALLRAQHVDGDPVQVVLRDGPDDKADIGRATGQNWTTAGRRRIELVLEEVPKAAPPTMTDQPRPTYAVIFGDVLGFSSLKEEYLPLFWDTVMRVIGDVIEAHKHTVALRNTWGDAVHLVVSDVRNAARICLEVQRELARIDGALLGRDSPPAMRIGCHYGPVFTGWDHIASQSTFYGRALSRAARIEPVTPPGAVYVTEAFAAILLLESRQEFTCTYVGQVPLAKGYGAFRMYDLTAVE